MGDVLGASLVALLTGILIKLVDNVLDRRKAARTATREDRHDALAEVEKLWARIDKMEADRDGEIEEIRAEHKAEIVELRTQIELYRHRVGQAERRALLAEQERDRLLAELGPLKTEVEHLRQRVRHLEGVNGNG